MKAEDVLHAKVHQREDDPSEVILTLEPREKVSDQAYHYLTQVLMAELAQLQWLPIALPQTLRPLPPGMIEVRDLQQLMENRLQGWISDGTLQWLGSRWRVVL